MIYEMHADRTSQCTEYMTLAYTGHNADAGATTEPKQIGHSLQGLVLLYSTVNELIV